MFIFVCTSFHLAFYSEDLTSCPAAYIFWSIFTSLVPTLFYFSVWKLAIAGHEFTLLVTLSPVIFAIRPVFRWMKTKGGQAVGHAMSMVAVAAVTLKGPGARLAAVTPAVGMGVLRAAAEWSGEDADMGYRGVGEYSSVLSVVGFGPLMMEISDWFRIDCFRTFEAFEPFEQSRYVICRHLWDTVLTIVLQCGLLLTSHR